MRKLVIGRRSPSKPSREKNVKFELFDLRDDDDKTAMEAWYNGAMEHNLEVVDVLGQSDAAALLAFPKNATKKSIMSRLGEPDKHWIGNKKNWTRVDYNDIDEFLNAYGDYDREIPHEFRKERARDKIREKHEKEINEQLKKLRLT